MNVTSIIDYSATHLQITNEGQAILVKKAYIEVGINPDDPSIINLYWHWYEYNDHQRLFYIDYRLVTTPSAASAADLLTIILGYLVSQLNGSTIYIDQSPRGSGSTFGAVQGTIDGINTVFKTSQNSYTAGRIQVYLNGQLLTQGAYSDYYESDPSTGEITFNFIPDATGYGTIITFVYEAPITNKPIYIDQKPLGTGSTFGNIQGDLDGINTVFKTSHNVYIPGKLQVYLNGQLMTQGAYSDYYESDATTGEITFTFIPDATGYGTVITFIYQIP